MRLRNLLATYALLCMGQACGISPVPEPPVQPPGPAPAFLASPTILEPCPSCIDGLVLHIVGGPGSTTSTSHIIVANLDGEEPLIRVSVQADGSFESGVAAYPGNEIRLIAEASDGRHSLPFDLVVPASGPASPATRPFQDCLVTAYDATASRTPARVELVNRCAVAVTLRRAGFRRSAPGLAAALGATPAELSPGATFPVEFARTSDAADEEFFLFEIDAPQRDRRAVLVATPRAP